VLARRYGRRVRVVSDGSLASDFLGMASAKVLVAAPSSLSYCAGIASRGAVLAPSPWWHHIPHGGRWFPVDSDGRFDAMRLGDGEAPGSSDA